ncbi:MFS transporter [Pseudomonas knackmussii]|uniref:MFS transporter n=1 Tax=Pseudomonas knackmussii TaxID=65741 RepID=UPI003F4A7EAF
MHTPLTTFPPGLDGQASAQIAPLYRKVLWRLLPFLLLAFVVNAIDRVNIAFAKLRMVEDIALSDAAYGLGVGAFYLGYILFEVPSNLYLQRIGARATLTRIMLLWGLVTLATAFVASPGQLIAARFLLGMAEAGFFPGVILYLTYWFPSALRGRITASFLMAGVVAGTLCGPLSSLIMQHLHGLFGLRDWQVLFVLTGTPAILLGLFGYAWLSDGPNQANWLDAVERQLIASALAGDVRGGHANFAAVLRDPRLYLIGAVYFSIYCGSNTVSYWLPSLIRGFGLEDLHSIGLITSLPYCLALIGMYLLGHSSDRRQERRWHLALTMLVSATCFALLGAVQGQLLPSILLMGVGAAAALTAVSLFWTIPPALLGSAGAAGGIAVISSIGNLAGVLNQAAIGAVRSEGGSLLLAFDLVALCLLIGSVLLLLGIPARALRADASASHGDKR